LGSIEKTKTDGIRNYLNLMAHDVQRVERVGERAAVSGKNLKG